MTLQVRQLVKHFGGPAVVRGVSFTVQPGECVALIGPNGAGKSTLFACIAGQHEASVGEVLWDGEAVTALAPAQRLQRGIGRTFQVAQTFEALTVLQNVQLLLQSQNALPAFDVLDTRHRAQALDLLTQVGLAHVAQVPAQELPYGAKKRLELAMVLATRPRLLLLDEPAAGLAGAERAQLMALVRSLASAEPGWERAVLYTEHHMDAVFGVADRVLVLLNGQLAAQGSPEQVAQDATVQAGYLGLGGPEPAPREVSVAPSPAQAPVLQVRALNAWWGSAQALFGVSLTLHAGELVVLQGLNGAGKSTLLQGIMGIGARCTGTISYQNESFEGLDACRRARAGLGYLPENRRLFTALTVRENLRLAARGKVAQNEARVLDLFPALKSMLRRPSDQMSGGEQQMLALARTLMGEPALLLLDEPCEGIAPQLVQTMVQALQELRRQGMPMLVAEQNHQFARSADRIVRLAAGQLMA